MLQDISPWGVDERKDNELEEEVEV